MKRNIKNKIKAALTIIGGLLIGLPTHAFADSVAKVQSESQDIRGYILVVSLLGILILQLIYPLRKEFKKNR